MSDDLPRHGAGERGLYKYDLKSNSFVKVAAPKKIILPYIHTDEIPPTESMATANREIFTSKSRLKQHYKEHGYEMTGGDHLGQKRESEKERKERQRREIREETEKALNLVKYNEAPLSELEKEIARREEREWKQYKKNRR